jgi:hypothetical protein
MAIVPQRLEYRVDYAAVLVGDDNVPAGESRRNAHTL